MNQVVQEEVMQGQAIQPTPQSALGIPDDRFVARRNFFNFLGIKCEIQGSDGRPLLFVHLKAFKLKEDITVYGDAAHTRPLISIKARQVLDFSAAYDIVDLTTGEKVGVMRRKGLKSLLVDEWDILDAADQPIGLLKEDSVLLAVLRRFLSSLIPQNYHLTLRGQVVASVEGTWNPFLVKHTMNMTTDTAHLLDRRLALAASVLLMVIEGKQR